MSKLSQYNRERKRPGIHKLYHQMRIEWPKMNNALLWQRVYERYDKEHSNKHPQITDPV